MPRLIKSAFISVYPRPNRFEFDFVKGDHQFLDWFTSQSAAERSSPA